MKKIIFGVVTYILENLRLPTISAILNKISNNYLQIIFILFLLYAGISSIMK